MLDNSTSFQHNSGLIIKLFYMIRIFLFTFCILISLSIKAENIKITVSSEALANIVSLVTQESYKIDVISQAGLCPHEYILKPSDFKKAQNSDFVIYMSDNFETFMEHITKNSKAQIINLSKKMHIPNTHNMHIWMSLESVKKIITIIAKEIHQKAEESLNKIDDLINYKKTQLAGLHNVLLLSNSLEYLFEDIPNLKIEKLYLRSGMISAKDVTVLSKYSADKCMLIDKNENISALLNKVGKKIIPVDSENWSLEGYKKIIDDIKTICISGGE